MTQLSFEDEKFGRNRPEPTRQERIDQLLKHADEREALADWYEKYHGHIYARGLRMAAQNDRSLAALMRR